MMHFGPIAPDGTLTIQKVVDIPRAMIVYPRTESLRPARELVVVESAVFGERR